MSTSLLSHVTSDGSPNLCLTHPATKCSLTILCSKSPSPPSSATWVVHNRDLCRCAVHGLSPPAQHAEFRSKYRIVSRPSNPEALAPAAEGEIGVMARAHGAAYTIAFYKYVFGLPLPECDGNGNIYVNVGVRVSAGRGVAGFTLHDPNDRYP
ncbi:hypothetical protein F4775DRAFT_3543 [Biscogniauxia sp. FL1348]|nr:hypothetical protein F4775DRAFT_3543 [Biscogniauxia sp. FL1348]